MNLRQNIDVCHLKLISPLLQAVSVQCSLTCFHYSRLVFHIPGVFKRFTVSHFRLTVRLARKAVIWVIRADSRVNKSSNAVGEEMWQAVCR